VVPVFVDFGLMDIRALHMQTFTSWLPATALVAVIIFVVKELLEVWRRYSSESRKLKAIKELLARECELNHWAIRSLRSIADELNAVADLDSVEAFSIEYAKSGRIYACIDSEAEGNYSKTAIPVIHKEQLTKHLLEVATLDKALFGLVEPALTAVAKLEHVRESLLYHGSSEEGDMARSHAQGFSEYATKEIEDARLAIFALYRACTGRELSDIRLR
jgi:hypothetical protein